MSGAFAGFVCFVVIPLSWAFGGEGFVWTFLYLSLVVYLLFTVPDLLRGLAWSLTKRSREESTWSLTD